MRHTRGVTITARRRRAAENAKILSWHAMMPRDRTLTMLLRQAVGTCPHCRRPEAVVYRRSRTSVTMRCECGLQWTMTMKMIARAVKPQLSARQDEGPSVDAGV